MLPHPEARRSQKRSGRESDRGFFECGSSATGDSGSWQHTANRGVYALPGSAQSKCGLNDAAGCGRTRTLACSGMRTNVEHITILVQQNSRIAAGLSRPSRGSRCKHVSRRTLVAAIGWKIVDGERHHGWRRGPAWIAQASRTSPAVTTPLCRRSAAATQELSLRPICGPPGLVDEAETDILGSTRPIYDRENGRPER